jgi:hypothetical protein
MTLGTTYSVGLGNAVPIVDMSAVATLFPLSYSVSGPFPLAGTSIQLSGNRYVLVGTPTGGPGPTSGTMTVNWSGGSASDTVTVTAVYDGPAVPPNITIQPVTMAANVSASKQLMDLDYAVSPSVTVTSGSVPSGTYIGVSVGKAYVTGHPTVPGTYTGTVSISYVGLGSPQTKSFSITVTP